MTALADAVAAVEALVQDRADTERQAAEHRMGLPAGHTEVVGDTRYGNLLDAWTDWRRASRRLIGARAHGPLVELSIEESVAHHAGLFDLFDLFDRLTGLTDLPTGPDHH